MKITPYFRNCPECNELIYSSTKRHCRYAEKDKRLCRSCASKRNYKINPNMQNTIKNLSKIAKLKKGKKLKDIYGEKRAKEISKKQSEWQIGYKRTNEDIQKRTETRRKNGWNKNPDLTIKKRVKSRKKNDGYIHCYKVWIKKYGKIEAEKLIIKYKKNLRLSTIKRIEQRKNNGNQIYPNYNPKSISILEQKAKELNITDLQHAENGGEFYIKELGYWVDGYSKEKNIVIEYYEKYHNKRKEKDKQRKKEIIDFLKCKFYIVKE